MRLNKLLILLVVFCFFYCGLNKVAFANNIDGVAANIAEINRYFAMDKESLPNDPVVNLATNVIQYRQLYSNEMVAKVYLLLAETATNKGDAVSAMQFALNGKGLAELQPELELTFLLKIVVSKFMLVFK